MLKLGIERDEGQRTSVVGKLGGCQSCERFGQPMSGRVDLDSVVIST